jgi:ribonuclease VapC
VLDGSAPVTFLRNVPGADKVAPVLFRSGISGVNLAESTSKLVATGKPLDAAALADRTSPHRARAFDLRSGEARSVYMAGHAGDGLSVGNRARIALDLQERLPVLTAERKWADVDVGVKPELIR